MLEPSIQEVKWTAYDRNGHLVIEMGTRAAAVSRSTMEEQHENLRLCSSHTGNILCMRVEINVPRRRPGTWNASAEGLAVNRCQAWPTGLRNWN
jgi:hypothetical protein